MDNQLKDNIYFICCLIEYIARITGNHRGEVALILDKEGIADILERAETYRGMPIKKVAHVVMTQYRIRKRRWRLIYWFWRSKETIEDIGHIYCAEALQRMNGEATAEAANAIVSVFYASLCDNFGNGFIFANGMCYYKPDMSGLYGRIGREIIECMQNTPKSDHTELTKKVEKAAAKIMELQSQGK